MYDGSARRFKSSGSVTFPGGRWGTTKSSFSFSPRTRFSPGMRWSGTAFPFSFTSRPSRSASSNAGRMTDWTPAPWVVRVTRLLNPSPPRAMSVGGSAGAFGSTFGGGGAAFGGACATTAPAAAVTASAVGGAAFLAESFTSSFLAAGSGLGIQCLSAYHHSPVAAAARTTKAAMLGAFWRMSPVGRRAAARISVS